MAREIRELRMRLIFPEFQPPRWEEREALRANRGAAIDHMTRAPDALTNPPVEDKPFPTVDRPYGGSVGQFIFFRARGPRWVAGARDK